LVWDDKRTVCLLDIGAQSTTINVVEAGVLKKSFSFDLSGNELVQLVSRSLNVDYKTGSAIIREKGLGESEPAVRKILITMVDYLISETQKILKSFYQSGGKEAEKFILAGGTAGMPGLKKYFLDNFKREVEIANPFNNIFYPPILEEKLKKMGPSYSVAVGLALRGLEIT
jgi:type IV pilus assembly protein PilM